MISCFSDKPVLHRGCITRPPSERRHCWWLPRPTACIAPFCNYTGPPPNTTNISSGSSTASAWYHPQNSILFLLTGFHLSDIVEIVHLRSLLRIMTSSCVMALDLTELLCYWAQRCAQGLAARRRIDPPRQIGGVKTAANDEQSFFFIRTAEFICTSISVRMQ